MLNLQINDLDDFEEEELILSKSELYKAHSKTIGASSAWRIMSDLSSPSLPAGARAYIESMVRDGEKMDRGEEPPNIQTESMKWGIAQELDAIEALEAHLNTSIDHTGSEQKRFYYGYFVSALPDGIINKNSIYAVVEVKCLDTSNHDSAINTVNSAADLKALDWIKYCQVQTQLLCTKTDYAVLAFYDPRHELPLHTVIIDPDQEWKADFDRRVSQAHDYYMALKDEDNSKPAFTESDTPAPEINNLPRVIIDLAEVKKYHKTPEELVKKIQKQAGSFVFDMTTSKGRDACRSHSANIIRCITPALNASKNIAVEARQVLESDLHFRKIFESGVREIADNARKPLNEWEAEQTRIFEEQARIEAEAIEQQRLEKQFNDDLSAALIENELFDLRKEKAEREAKALQERQAQEKADYERKLQEQAVERERQRIYEAHRIAELNRQRKEEQDEEEKQAAIAAAIEGERKRQVEIARREAEEQARIKKEEARLASNKAHRQKINGDIFKKLSSLGVDDSLAKDIIVAAAKGNLGNLIINYCLESII